MAHGIGFAEFLIVVAVTLSTVGLVVIFAIIFVGSVLQGMREHSAGRNGTDVRLVQDLHRQAQRIEKRVEALEEILLQSEETPRFSDRNG